MTRISPYDLEAARRLRATGQALPTTPSFRSSFLLGLILGAVAQLLLAFAFQPCQTTPTAPSLNRPSALAGTAKPVASFTTA
jgi:hypothetical protein